MNALEPVSYTHLDVYKRQLERLLAAMVHAVGEHDERLPALLFLHDFVRSQIHRVVEQRPAPVSYTHLFGEKMRQSHRSLRDQYEVSCRELDLMVELAEDLPGYWGGRMTGGGFGGCTVNLVNAADAPAFTREIAARYHQATGIQPDVYICSAADGASSLPIGED